MDKEWAVPVILVSIPLLSASFFFPTIILLLAPIPIFLLLPSLLMPSMSYHNARPGRPSWASSFLDQTLSLRIGSSDLMLRIHRCTFSAASDVKTLVFPLASNIFVGKGCWSIFIGFWALELSNLILPDSIVDCSCCPKTLHSFVPWDVVLCHLQYFIYFNSPMELHDWATTWFALPEVENQISCRPWWCQTQTSLAPYAQKGKTSAFYSSPIVSSQWLALHQNLSLLPHQQMTPFCSKLS